MTFADIFWFPGLLILTAVASYHGGRFLRLPYRLALSLFAWHTGFCVFYWYYAQNNSADANGYYDAALQGIYNWWPGTMLVNSFTALFAHGLRLSELNTFVIYNMFGLAGLLLLAHVLLVYWPHRRGWRRYIPYALMFLPGLSFWSAAIGKDAPAFFAACLGAYAFVEIPRRKLIFVLAVLVMFSVRPHVGLLMLIAATVALLSDSRIGTFSRALTVTLLGGAALLLMPYVIQKIGFGEERSLEAVGSYLELRQGYNLEGGSGVDIASLPLPMKMFTYLFRPLFIDAPGALGIVVSFEDVVLLCVFFLYFGRYLHRILRDASTTFRYNLVFFLSGLVVFSLTTANMGIAIRQKIMILPSFFCLMVFAARSVPARNRNKGKAAAKKTVTVPERIPAEGIAGTPEGV